MKPRAKKMCDVCEKQCLTYTHFSRRTVVSSLFLGDLFMDFNTNTFACCHVHIGKCSFQRVLCAFRFGPNVIFSTRIEMESFDDSKENFNVKSIKMSV